MGVNESRISNSTIYDPLCLSAKEIASTPGFSFMLILEIILGFAAALPNCFLMFMIWKVSAFHPNLRLTLAHLSFILVWYSLGYAAKALIIIPTILAGDPCTLMTNAYDCKMRDVWVSIPAVASLYAGLAVALERFYSTIFYEKYEDHWKKHHSLGWILALFPYVVPIGTNIPSWISGRTISYLPICENAYSSKFTTSVSSISISLITTLICSIVVVIIWHMNNTKLGLMMANRAQHSLGARFQIQQNVEVNKIIVPSTVLLLLCFIPNYIFLLLIIFGLPLSDELKIILIHVNYIWKQAYALAHPIVCVVRHKRIRRELTKSLPLPAIIRSRVSPCSEKKSISTDQVKKNARAVNTISTKDHDAHFQVLNDAWDALADKKGRKK